MDPNDQKKTACYDIDVEVEDPLKSQMSSFLLSTANQQEIASLDNKVSSESGLSATQRRGNMRILQTTGFDFIRKLHFILVFRFSAFKATFDHQLDLGY